MELKPICTEGIIKIFLNRQFWRFKMYKQGMLNPNIYCSFNGKGCCSLNFPTLTGYAKKPKNLARAIDNSSIFHLGFSSVFILLQRMQGMSFPSDLALSPNHRNTLSSFLQLFSDKLQFRRLHKMSGQNSRSPVVFTHALGRRSLIFHPVL